MTDDKTVFDILRGQDIATILTELEAVTSDAMDLVDEAGQTPLHLAVFNHQVEVAAVLLNKGAQPNKKNSTMLSPFIAAAANGLSDMFKLILAYEPDLTETNRFGGSALLPSSEKGFIRVVQQALDAGVPVNHINRLGWTALLEAVVLGDEGFLFRDIVEELMTFKADASIKDFDGKSAIDYSQEKATRRIADILTKELETTEFTEIKQWIRDKDNYLAIQALLKMEPSLEQFYYLAFAYEGLEQYDAAFYYYEKGLKADPQFAYYLANLAKATGQVERSLSYFDRGANSSSNRAFFIYHKSNYLRELGRHPEALEVMDELLANDPKRVDYMFHKANSLRSLGDLQAAYDVMVQADLLQAVNPLFREQAEQIKMEMNNMEDTGNG